MLAIIPLLFSLICSVQAAVYCNETQSCPESLPCCSLTGECGTGQYCLGSCNPKFSFDLDSCLPVPVCKNLSTKFNGYASKLIKDYTYMGNVSQGDWLYSGYAMDYDDEESLILAMPKDTTGSVISHTRYMWYGKVSARLKTSHLKGVVTAAILYSQVQDEIDFEFVGADLKTAQTNFYWESVLNYTNSKNISTTDTFDNFHTYEVDWQEDHIKWSIDGVVGRTLYKNETYNSTSGVYQYPQTPARIQISLWPGGSADSAEGTREWAGGLIDWDAPDLTDPGYYYMILNEVNVTCYDSPAGTTKNGTEAYKFIDKKSFLQKDVAIVDANMMIGSDNGTGSDPLTSKKQSSSSSTQSSTSSSSSSSTTTSSTILEAQRTQFFQDMNATSTSQGGAIRFSFNDWLAVIAATIFAYII